jgi:hypothetical protein
MGFLVLGILGGLICIVASGMVTKQYRFDSWGERGVAWYLIIVGVAAILQGMFVLVLLEAGAEIIRLLKAISLQQSNTRKDV